MIDGGDWDCLSWFHGLKTMRCTSLLCHWSVSGGNGSLIFVHLQMQLKWFFVIEMRGKNPNVMLLNLADSFLVWTKKRKLVLECLYENSFYLSLGLASMNGNWNSWGNDLLESLKMQSSGSNLREFHLLASWTLFMHTLLIEPTKWVFL